MTREANAYIDLSALRHNLSVVKKYQPNSNILAVIKSNGYGHGAEKVAEALVDADAFAIASVDEAKCLRNIGVDKRLVLLEGFYCPSELEDIISEKLEIVVHCDWQLEFLEQYSCDKRIQVWLKIDTGMNRLGFLPNRFDEVYSRLKKCNAVSDNIYVMTHLACADDLDSNFTKEQLKRFRNLSDIFSGSSVLNSAGIMGWSDNETLNDIVASSENCWCRPGIMLYGVSPFCIPSSELLPVMTLKSKIISIKDCPKGSCVSYSGTWKAQRDSVIGVVSIGYGDGYPRHAKNGTPVLVNNHEAQIAGRVTMDMICIDLTDVPDVQIGDEVTLWGKDLPIERIADASGTIGYELLCGITKRVNIVYG